MWMYTSHTHISLLCICIYVEKHLSAMSHMLFNMAAKPIYTFLDRITYTYRYTTHIYRVKLPAPKVSSTVIMSLYSQSEANPIRN